MKCDKTPTQNRPEIHSHGIPDFRLVEKITEIIPVKVQPSLKEAVKAVSQSSVNEFCRTAIIEKLERIKGESH